MKASELVLAPNGSLYHIHLDSSTLADKVLLVGDPGRVNMFKDIFDSVEFESQNRELHALTGTYHGTRMTALSTGMGCDNIDIVMTELDAALRVKNGKWNARSNRHLQIIRIGTSGSLQADIDCGSRVAAECAVGLDGLMNYYKEWVTPLPEMEQAFAAHMHLPAGTARPYYVQSNATLLELVAYDMHHGITATAPGFYGPQGRTIRLHPAIKGLNEKLASFEWTDYTRTFRTECNPREVRNLKEITGLRVTNLEMETSAIYGFSHLLGHEALTVCLIIANRPKGTFLNDYHAPMRQLVGTVVERMATI
ncbi:MAG: nucleoside phosphorylase [Bacteroidales bacterium]|nr:nucleoside phosphorylase [Bacteroidales bacterium]